MINPPQKILYNINISDEAKKNCETCCRQVISKVSSRFNLTGFTELLFDKPKQLENMFDMKTDVGGELKVIHSNPPEYQIICYLNMKMSGGEILSTLVHEMAHVDDQNNIPQIYCYRNSISKNTNGWDALRQLFSLQIWAEFYATWKSNEYSSLDNAVLCLIKINQMVECLDQSNRGIQNWKMKSDILILMARFLGEILREDICEVKPTNKISNLPRTITLLRELDSELQKMIKTYPKWVDFSVFDNLGSILEDFVNDEY